MSLMDPYGTVGMKEWEWVPVPTSYNRTWTKPCQSGEVSAFDFSITKSPTRPGDARDDGVVYTYEPGTQDLRCLFWRLQRNFSCICWPGPIHVKPRWHPSGHSCKGAFWWKFCEFEWVDSFWFPDICDNVTILFEDWSHEILHDGILYGIVLQRNPAKPWLREREHLDCAYGLELYVEATHLRFCALYQMETRA